MNKMIKELLIISLGSFLIAVAVGMFILPSSILTGGVAGISVLLLPFIKIPESTMIFILNVGLLALGTVFMGKKFLFNTCVSSVLYPVMLKILERFVTPVSMNPILAAIYGGILGGIGIGLVVRQGASTGGMDIPPILLKKFFNIDVSKSLIFFDSMTVLAGLFIYGLEPVLIGLISVYSTGMAIDKVLTFGGMDAKKVEIISDEYQKIQEDIHKIVDRGTTLIEAEGGYTKDRRKVLMVIINNSQYTKLMEVVDKYDKDAFVIVSDVVDVHGKGFTKEVARL